MKPIVIPRMPAASCVLAFASVMVHFALCRPAATSRGYPSIHPFWEEVAPYLAYLGILMFPLFDDEQTIRRRMRNCFVVAACLFNGIVAANLSSARPHIGHLTGIGGILLYDPFGVMVFMFAHLMILFPCAFVAERSANAVWSWCREFADANRSGPEFRFNMKALLGFTAVAAAVTALAVWGTRTCREWPRAQWSYECGENLRQIAYAILEYEQAHGTLPAAYVADDAGKPIHSWRVLILPFLGEDDLYKIYRFDEPWDGPNNRKLADKMPPVYRCPWNRNKLDFSTSYVLITGAHTAFPGSTSRTLKSISDGMSQTIFAVEAPALGFHWMEPRDIDFDELLLKGQDELSSILRTDHYGGQFEAASVAFGDGTTRHLDPRANFERFRALITADGGEPIPWGDW